MDVRTLNKATAYMALFKAIPNGIFVRQQDMVSAYSCLSNGFIFLTKGGALINPVPTDLCRAASSLYGTDIKAFNQTFHKSYNTVANMTAEEYFMGQFMHYLSTYGAEYFGIKCLPYIPTEELNIPNVEFKVPKITVITAVEGWELEDMLDTFLRNTRNPNDEQVSYIKTLAEDIKTPFSEIRSFELQCILYSATNTYPENIEAAFRYLLYKITGQTLIIKNREFIYTIKHCLNSYNNEVKWIFEHYSDEEWAKIFFRFKPLFLALKERDDFRAKINRIRRKADACHVKAEPFGVKILAQLVKENKVDEIDKIIEKASTRDLIKVMSLCIRDSVSVKAPKAFHIRNGKIFIKPAQEKENWESDNYIKRVNTINIIYNTIITRIRETIKGKEFYIPDFIDYAVPTSEKQFTGNLPWGTMIRCPDDGAFTVGIQWFDGKNGRTDLDLHLNGVSGHFGWNASYKNGKSIIYTGDMTAAPAPNGAAEAFFFEPDSDENYVLSVRKYCGEDQQEFKFAVSRQDLSKYDIRQGNFTFSQPVFSPITMKFDATNKAGDNMSLGMFIGKDFYVYGGELEGGRIPSKNYEDYIEAVSDEIICKLSIRDLFDACDATIYSDDEYLNLADSEKKEVINLSPEALTSNTLLNIVDGVKA